MSRERQKSDGEDDVRRTVDAEILDELEQLHHRLARLRDERGSLVSQLGQLDEMYHHSAQQVRELRSKLANLEAILKSRKSIDYEEIIETMSRVEREKLLLEKKISVLERRNRNLEIKEAKHKEEVAILNASFQKLEAREERLVSRQQKLMIKCDRIRNILSIRLENKSQECEDLKKLNAYLASRKMSDPSFPESGPIHSGIVTPDFSEIKELSLFDELKEVGSLQDTETEEADSLCPSSLALTRCPESPDCDSQSLSSGFISTSVPPPQFDLEIKSLKKQLLTCIQILNYIKKVGFQVPKEIFVYPLITQNTDLNLPSSEKKQEETTNKVGIGAKATCDECAKISPTEDILVPEQENNIIPFNTKTEVLDAQLKENDSGIKIGDTIPLEKNNKKADTSIEELNTKEIEKTKTNESSLPIKEEINKNAEEADSKKAKKQDISTCKVELPCPSSIDDTKENENKITKDSKIKASETDMLNNKDKVHLTTGVVPERSPSPVIEQKICSIPQRLRRSSLFPTKHPESSVANFNKAIDIENVQSKSTPLISQIAKGEAIDDEEQKSRAESSEIIEIGEIFTEIKEETDDDANKDEISDMLNEEVGNAEIQRKLKKSVHDVFKETFTLLKKNLPLNEHDSKKEEEEIEGKFSQLLLAIKIDQTTLDARVQRIANQRDIIQNNLRRELQKVKDELNTLYTNRSLESIVNVISKTFKILDIVSEALARLSGRSENLGMINQEKRFMEACELMMRYSEYVRERYTAQKEEIAQLQGKLKECQDSTKKENKRPITMRSISLLSEPLRKLKEIQENSKANRRHSNESGTLPQIASETPEVQQVKPVLQKRKTIIPVVRSESQSTALEPKVVEFILDRASAMEPIPPQYNLQLCWAVAWGIGAFVVLAAGVFLAYLYRS